MPNRNLAFYKKSGDPWTKEEYEKICDYTGDSFPDNLPPSRKFLFDDGASTCYMYTWHLQKRKTNFKNCKQVAYEDIFKTTNPFQVGDIVRSISTPHGNAPKRFKGSTHTVLRISKNTIDYETDYVALYENFELVSRPSQQVEPSSNLPKTKETHMNTSFQEILAALFGAQNPTTDYEKRPAILVVAYNRDGSQMATATAAALDDVKAKVASTPELWGCKVLTYSLSDEVSVAVPVKSTKAKIHVPAEPAAE